MKTGYFTCCPMVKTSPSSAGRVLVQSLARELKSHIPLGQKTKNVKERIV